jgi:hypothetical protein
MTTTADTIQQSAKIPEIEQPTITSLAGLKRVLAEPGVTLTLISVTLPDGTASRNPFHVDTIGKPRTVSKAQSNGVAIDPYDGQLDFNGKPKAVSWLWYGKASEWTFGELDGKPVISRDNGGGALTYTVTRSK